MKALIVTNIPEEKINEEHPLYREAQYTLANINKSLSKFKTIVFIMNQSDNAFEIILNKNIKIENCKKDFYIFKKEKEDDNLFNNKEFKKLFRKKNIKDIYISGFNLGNEITNLALESILGRYKTKVIKKSSFNFFN